jgi:hypothetical protein
MESALEAAQNLLRQSLPSMHNLPDAATVARVRDLVRSPAVQSALERSSDTFLAFALRAVEHVVANQSQTDRETISRLWDILDDPHPEPSLRAPAELSHHVRAIPKETLTAPASTERLMACSVFSPGKP